MPSNDKVILYAHWLAPSWWTSVPKDRLQEFEASQWAGRACKVHARHHEEAAGKLGIDAGRKMTEQKRCHGQPADEVDETLVSNPGKDRGVLLSCAAHEVGGCSPHWQ